MSAAQNAQRQYAFVAETSFGVTPTTPQTQLMEVVNFTPELNAAQLSDPSIRSDRQVGFSRRGNLGVEGDIEVVMCADNYDEFLEAVTGGTWTTDVLKIGNVSRSFTLEEGFLDIGQYRVFNGVRFNTLNMNVTPDALVNATFGVMGAGASAFTGAALDATPTAIVPKDKFFHEGGTIQEGGVTVAYLTGITFTMTNNMEGTYALGSTSYRAITPGKVNVTGTMTALLESVDLYNKFKNSVDSSVSFTLVAGAETLKFDFPKVKYTTGSLTRAESGPVLVELGFEAVYETGAASTLVITRT